MAWTLPRTWTDGELVTAALMNAHVRDNLLTVPHLISRKTADQSVTSSVVVVNCTEMVAAVAANEVWQFTWFVAFQAGTTGHLRVAFTFPAAGHIAQSVVWDDTASVTDTLVFSGTTTPTIEQNFRSITASVTQTILISGIYTNAGTAGNVQMQFAQSVSNGTATTIKANAHVMGMKLA